MNNIKGKCVCGAVEITIKKYGNFVYSCHCNTCRRQNSGPVMSIDPGPKENVEFIKGANKITHYPDEEVDRGFCSICGTNLFWHNPADNHYCMNAELFDEIIKNASFELELFYDSKPSYYAYEGDRKKLDRNFKEIL
ncbi:aldehyde-activating protein [Clostridia bacterium]|nr:aldehyde-activating protein [Clostridia bacterium]